VRSLSLRRQDVSTELKKFIEEAESLIATSAQMQRSEVSGMIRSIVETKLRPLSHELWDQEQRRTPGFSQRELALKALRIRPYRVLWVTTFFALGSLSPTLVIAGSQRLLPLLLLTVPVFFSLLLANLLRTHSGLAKDRYVGLLIATSLCGGVGGTFLLALFGIFTNPLLTLTSTWWLGTLIVIVGVFAVAIEDSAKQKSELDELASGELDREAAASLRGVTNRELANQLHSRTQNHLLAQAMRVDSGADIEAELRELKRVLASLSQPHFADVSLSELTQRWQGLLTIAWNLEREPSVLELRVIEEAINNSYRHGLASELEVRLTDAELEVIDDGLGPTSGNAGLGSRLYGSAGDWTLTSLDSGGSKLKVSLKS
jgi:signal transduction histidine kinase